MRIRRHGEQGIRIEKQKQSQNLPVAFLFQHVSITGMFRFSHDHVSNEDSVGYRSAQCSDCGTAIRALFYGREHLWSANR